MKGEQTPCNMTHDFQVDAAKTGISEAGGTPREFTTISVSDGISMNHEGMKFSLLSREIIADSIEAVMHGLAYDALIGFGGCDKTLPGVMMGMVRCNVPSIFIYGGSALPGRYKGKTLTALDSYEAVGAFMTGDIDAATLEGIERVVPADHRRLRRPVHRQYDGDGVRGDGHDHAQCLDDARRLCRARADSRGTPDVWSWTMLQHGGPLPRDIVTRKSLENGAAIVAATGGSTNAALHLPAHRQRGRHRIHPRRCRRGVRAHAADRQSAAGRQIYRQGCLRYRRHGGRDPRAGRERPYRRFLPDHHRPHHRGSIWRGQQARWRDHLQHSASRSCPMAASPC